eukprot:1177860-Prorocentrum_minimum.AAC.2
MEGEDSPVEAEDSPVEGVDSPVEGVDSPVEWVHRLTARSGWTSGYPGVQGVSGREEGKYRSNLKCIRQDRLRPQIQVKSTRTSARRGSIGQVYTPSSPQTPNKSEEYQNQREEGKYRSSVNAKLASDPE